MSDFWAEDGMGSEIFPTGMAQRRLDFYLGPLDTRQQRNVYDKLAPIQEVFETFSQNCKHYYTVEEYATLDEK